MRPGVSIKVADADRARLAAIIADRNSPQKHVWRAQVVLLTAAGSARNEIMRATGKSARSAVWRWQERYIDEGVDGLLRDKTRPSRIPKLAEAKVARGDRLTTDGAARTGRRTGPSGRWRRRPAVASARCSASGARTVSCRIAGGSSSCPTIPPSSRRCEDVVGLYVDPPAHAVVLSIDEKSADPGARSHPARPADEAGPAAAP